MAVENENGSADQNETDDLVVELVDDTPADDQRRKPLAHDPLEKNDEAEEYSAGVKKRLGELRHAAHDARRAKEAAERERDEAARVAKVAYAEAKTLRQQLTSGEVSYAGEVKSKAQLAIQAARAKHRQAYEAGDPDALADATAELAAATQQAQQAENWERSAQQRVNDAVQKEKDGVDSEQQAKKAAPAPATPDARTLEWVEENKSWYGTDPVMTSLAYGIHEKLLKSGVHPVEDADEYYGAIDAEMRRRFPEFEWEGEPAKTTATKPKPKSTVAAVNRTAPGKNKVVVTASQAAIAKKLGITVEQYARELVNIQNEQNGA